MLHKLLWLVLGMEWVPVVRKMMKWFVVLLVTKENIC